MLIKPEIQRPVSSSRQAPASSYFKVNRTGSRANG